MSSGSGRRRPGTCSWTRSCRCETSFTASWTGSLYTMDVDDDSDTEVYKAIGKTMTLRALCEAMIKVSSNFAANL